VATRPEEMRPRGTTLPAAERARALRVRGVDPEEVRRVWQFLADPQRPDPAGVLVGIAREQVEEVAVYLHARSGPVWYPTPDWVLLARGHPAARAIFLHEWHELAAYGRLGIRRPLRVQRPGATYAKAHAWASWQEARYWEAWAEAEGEEIPAPAFQRAHLVRNQSDDEFLAEARALKRTWTVSFVFATTVELEKARAFYVRQSVTAEGFQQWLKQSVTDRS
jgi:hypothetical protein